MTSSLSAKEKFKKLEATANICTMCSLCKNRTNAVFGNGNPKANGMLIGEGPGKTEDETGLPFVGSAGRHLDRVMIKVGLDRSELYITNIVKCHHRGQKPTMGQINACHPYLEAQLAEIQPKLLILTGASSLQGVMGKAYSITKVHGVLMETPYPAVKAIAVYHPSYLIYRQSLSTDSPLWKEWEKDWRKIRHYLDHVA